MARRRAEILRITRELLSESGEDGLSVRDLAARAGVAITTIYSQFGSKDELVYEAVADFYTSVLNHVDPLLPPLEAIAALAAELTRHSIELPVYSAAITQIYFGPDTADPLRETMSALLRDWLAALLVAMRRRGQLGMATPVDLLARDTCLHAWALVQEFHRGILPGRQLAARYELAICATLCSFAATDFRPLLERRVRDLAASLSG